MLFWRSGLFRKDIEPSCLYCRRGARIRENEVACVKRGIVPADGSCRAFRYDPLKRIPPRPAVLRTEGLSAADFSLDDPSADRDALPEKAGELPLPSAPADDEASGGTGPLSDDADPPSDDMDEASGGTDPPSGDDASGDGTGQDTGSV